MGVESLAYSLCRYCSTVAQLSDGPRAGQLEKVEAKEVYMRNSEGRLTFERILELCPKLREGTSSIWSKGNPDDARAFEKWLEGAKDELGEYVRDGISGEKKVVDQILWSRRAGEASEGLGGNEYKVKWLGRPHRACMWVPRRILVMLSKRKLQNFETKTLPKQKYIVDTRKAGGDDDDDDWADGVERKWLEVDRIVSSRGVYDAVSADEYLVKWRGLGYESATWESAASLGQENDKAQIAKYVKMREAYAAKLARLKRGEGGAERDLGYKVHKEQPEYLGGGYRLQLHDYQLEGVNWMLLKRSQGINCILADEMGLGKTVQIASLLGILHKEITFPKPFLVVVPLSTITNWQRELGMWCPFLNTVVYHDSSKVGKALIYDWEFDPEGVGVPMFDVLVTTYETLVGDSSILARYHWECLVVDEGHRLKTPDSK